MDCPSETPLGVSRFLRDQYTRRTPSPSSSSTPPSPSAAGTLEQRRDGLLERGAGRDRRPVHPDQPERPRDGREERTTTADLWPPGPRSPTATW